MVQREVNIRKENGTFVREEIQQVIQNGQIVQVEVCLDLFFLSIIAFYRFDFCFEGLKIHSHRGALLMQIYGYLETIIILCFDFVS
jgi:hypothetical protein